MFKPAAEYYSVLHLTDTTLISELTGIKKLLNAYVSYPSSKNEVTVMEDYSEMLDKLKSISGVKTERITNSLHYTCDVSAVELEATIIEKHNILFNNKDAGYLAVCADGFVYSTSGTLQ